MAQGGPDLVARYFLRWLAIELRKIGSDDACHIGAIRLAKLETIRFFVVLPTATVLSFVVILSLPWLSSDSISRVASAPSWFWWAVGLVTVYVGLLWLRRKLAAIVRETDAFRAFDTERDRRLVEWQRSAMLFVAAFSPLAAFLVLGLLQ